MRPVRAIAGLAVAACLAACASPLQLSLEPEPGLERSGGVAYAWVTSDVSATGGWEPEQIERLDRDLRDTLIDRLDGRGYRQVPREAAEVLIGYRMVVRRVDEVDRHERERRAERAADASQRATTGSTVPERDEPGGFSGEAMLVLSMTDVDGELLWRGVAEYELHSDPQTRRTMLRAARQLGSALPDVR